MDRVNPASRLSVACDILLAGRAAANGVTAQTARTHNKYWNSWCSYCKECNISNPFLDDLDRIEHPIIITGFAARVRSGAYGLGNQVGVQTVSNALAAVSKTINMACKPSPIYETPGTYILPVERCIEGFRREDPPSVPQLAVPVAVPEESAKRGWSSSDPYHQAVGDLSLIAFYFLLRSGEYTKPRLIRRNGKMIQATRTKQFRVQDIGFWRDGKQLSRYSPLSELLTADAASMRITNQKNGRMGELIYQESTGPNGAVAALARRVDHILTNGGDDDNLICDVCTTSKWCSVTSTSMVAATRTSVKTLKLGIHGFDSDLVGAHSLRAGGAMALKLEGYKDSTIRKLGRWKSDTWQMYIHTQIDKLHQGVATSMSKPHAFKNIAFIEPPKAATMLATA